MNKIMDNSLKSIYLAMPDAVKLAADIWLPVFEQGQQKLPAIVRFTRYWRAYELMEDKKENQPVYEAARYWNDHGYAFAIVDTRGSGASFGYRDGEFSIKEINDLGVIVEQLATQEWSNGIIIAEGTSYSANLAVLSCINKPKALKVVHSIAPDFDGYVYLMAPGGIPNRWLGDTFSGMIEAMDRNDMAGVLKYNPRKGGSKQGHIKGVRPVDGDFDKSMLNEAVKEHLNNRMSSLAGEDFSARDSSQVILKATEAGSLFNYGDKFTSNNNAIINYEVGWFDAGTVAGALAFYDNFSASTHVIIGPWNHGSIQQTDPLLHREPRSYSVQEKYEFVRGNIEGSLNGSAKGISRQITYYTLGQNKWKSTSQWPVEGVAVKRYYLRSGNLLSDRAPAADEPCDIYRAVLTATTGCNNRWHTQIGTNPVYFPNRAEEDKKLLVFDTEALSMPVEVTGDINISIWLKCNKTSGAIFAYFELINETGEVMLLTETQLNLLYINESKNCIYNGLARNLLLADRHEMHPGESYQVKLKMLPISVEIPAGYRIRLALAAADCDTFSQLNDSDTVFTILHDEGHLSYMDMPVVEKNRTEQ